MKQETYFDRLKKVGCVVWVLFGLMELACAFLIVGGGILAIAFWGEQTGRIALLGVGTGVLGGGFFAFIALVLPYIQHRKGITAETVRAWPSGVLTDTMIRRKLQKKYRNIMLSGLGVTALVALLVFPLLWATDTWDSSVLTPVACILILLGMSLYQLIPMKKHSAFRVVEDRVIGNHAETKMDLVDVATTHLPTREYKLIFEHHGEYLINFADIHDGYLPQELMELIEVGEKVYLVYAKNSDKILYIYRQKYWTREEKTQ